MTSERIIGIVGLFVASGSLILTGLMYFFHFAYDSGSYANKIDRLEAEFHYLQGDYKKTNEEVRLLTPKVTRLEKDFEQYQADYKRLSEELSVLWFNFTKNDEKLGNRIKNYFGASLYKNIPANEKAKTLELLKTINSSQGIEYLIKNQGFKQEEASSIFDHLDSKTGSQKNK